MCALDYCKGNKLRITRSLALLSGILLTTSLEAGVFLLDDGSAETWGGTTEGDLLSLNHFNTAGQTMLIDRISVAWNPLSSRVSPTVALYADPNGDGNPSDMTLLRFDSIILQPGVVYLNQSLQHYSIPATAVTGSFFVGAFLSDADSGIDPGVGIDTSPPNYYGQSWIIENSLGPGRLSLNDPIGTSTLRTRLDTYVAGNFLIQAQYSIVPEPSFGWFSSIALLIAALRRRHRSRTDVTQGQKGRQRQKG